eukprot:m.240224 g.240224  ORF g.240224 m.240224 type:complete len:514 (-) comp14705_c0_seq1:625-2166(-)
MVRVLIIAPVSHDVMHVGGGVAITYKIVAHQLREQGHEVTVLSSWNGSLGYSLITLKPDFRMIKASLSNWSVLAKNIKLHDVVVCPDSLLVPLIGLECYKQGVPGVWVIHTNFMAVAKNAMSGPIFALYDIVCQSFLRTYGLAFKHILTTSRDYMDNLQQQGFDMSGHIDQGFKAEVFKMIDPAEKVEEVRRKITFGRPTSSIVLLYAGRFSEEKRIPLLIESLPKDKRFILVLVGDGDQKEKLVQYHGKDNKIYVVAEMKPQEELRLFYKAADLTVSASDFETFGMTVHESLLCGTPVVVQDGHGFRSQVKHGCNGFLVDFANTTNARKMLKDAVTHPFTPIIYRPDNNCVDLVPFIIDTALGRETKKLASSNALKVEVEDERFHLNNAGQEKNTTSDGQGNIILCVKEKRTRTRTRKRKQYASSPSSSSSSSLLSSSHRFPASSKHVQTKGRSTKPYRTPSPLWEWLLFTVLQFVFLIPASFSQWLYADKARREEHEAMDKEMVLKNSKFH